MSEEEANIKYIKEQLSGICQDCMWLDKILPIINEIQKTSYKSGLVQAEIDNTMEIIEENKQLKESIDMYSGVLQRTEKEKAREEIIHYQLRQRIDKAIEYIEESIKNPMYAEYICANDNGEVENLDKLLEILKGDSNE